MYFPESFGLSGTIRFQGNVAWARPHPMENTLFYNQLPIYSDSLSTLLGRPELFQRVPTDWYVVLTDIKNSTRAVDGGLSQVVNLIATGSIVAALNIASEAKIDIPFFFGGDGATLLIPEVLLQDIMAALHTHRSNVRDEFDLDLRVGSFPVSRIYQDGIGLNIAKVRMNALFAIPLVLGSGLQRAEQHIKSNYSSPERGAASEMPLRLEGMECRWNKIPPPKNSDEVICLLIDALQEQEQASVFKQVLDCVERIYGPHQRRNPISVPQLKLNGRLGNLRTELRARTGAYGLGNLLRDWTITLFGKFWYFRGKAGQQYLAELVQLSDILVVDGRINMVISGPSESRKPLIDFLEEQERQGKLIFGIHASTESIISCYVRNRKADHIHFVDGGAGGYTKAATMLKQKGKNRNRG